MYEELLKDYCDLSAFPEVLGKSMIGAWDRGVLPPGTRVVRSWYGVHPQR